VNCETAHGQIAIYEVANTNADLYQFNILFQLAIYPEPETGTQTQYLQRITLAMPLYATFDPPP
jgi:hypothetical protein